MGGREISPGRICQNCEGRTRETLRGCTCGSHLPGLENPVFLSLSLLVTQLTHPGMVGGIQSVQLRVYDT